MTITGIITAMVINQYLFFIVMVMADIFKTKTKKILTGC